MSSSEQLLLKSLTNYFQRHPKHRDVLYKIVTGQYSISLRVIDWFITHYAKAMNILYWIDESKSPHGSIVEQLPNNAASLAQYKKFHLYYEYRAQLKSYTKMHFDPFRRHERIEFALDSTRVIETTVGQLNFFRWALQNHVIDYIHQYLPQIEGHMSLHQSKKAEPATQPTQSAQPVPSKHARKPKTKKDKQQQPQAPTQKPKESKDPNKTKISKPSNGGGKLKTHATPTRITQPCQLRFD